jgi:membrane fusion protein (multidrug efflux system)
VLIAVGAVVGIALSAYFLIPFLMTALNTVSTDDAYVNGHVTLVAPRVAGQVKEVLVDDNKRVKKGDILVRLDKTPFQVQVDFKKSAVESAERDLGTAISQVLGLEAKARSQRWAMETAMYNVVRQIADLRSKFADLETAKKDLKRGDELVPSGGISKEQLDQRRLKVETSLQAVYSARAALDLSIQPPPGQDLTYVPPNLDQTYSGVRAALATLMETTTQLGLPLAGSNDTPREFLGNFTMRDFRPPVVADVGTIGAFAATEGPLLGISSFLAGKGDIDRILEQLVPKAPAVLQAEAKVKQAKADLAQAELNLLYTDVVSDIDGQVTRRNVNPGNNVVVGQSLMAVRSMTEIWIDANFKETQLADMRLGQRVKIEVDMYGGRHEFEGRVTGFTMGTGQTLALLPPQNATGNFVKIVQRLPVRVELTDYNPEKSPLFVGLSVTPYVYFKEPAVGPDAGKFLQPFLQLPQAPAYPKPR